MVGVRRIIALLILFAIAGCAPAVNTPAVTSSLSPGIRAVYLVQGTGQLPQEELRGHPEVVVTDSFAELKELARSKVALWIDIGAVGLVDLQWLGQPPQLYYPVVLVGDGDWYCSFLWTMQYFMFNRPPKDCSSPPPGFSVNMQKTKYGGYNKDYEQVPTVQGILDITNPMLDGLK